MIGTKQTGQTKIRPNNKLILGSDDIRDYIVGYSEALAKALTAIWFSTPGTFGTAKANLSEALDTGVYKLALSTPSAADGVAGGSLLSYDTGATDAAGTVSACPYKRTGATTYHIGFKKNERPSLIVASGGLLHLKRWVLTVGESGAPNSVTDNGNGTMTLNVNTLAASAAGGVWGNHATLYRRATVWLNDPQDTSLSIVSNAQAKSNGTNVTIDIAHAMGQATISTTAADYTVLLEGLSVSETDLSAETDADGNLAYWYLGAVTDGTFDYSAQNLLSTPGTFALDLAQLATDIYDSPSLDGDGAANLSEPLQQTVRMLRHDVDQWLLAGLQGPCIYIPGIAETYGWGTGYTIVDTGANRRITFPALPAGGVIFTGDSDGVLRPCGDMPTGNYVDFAEAGAADTYVVYVEAEVFDATAGSEDVKARLKVVTDGAFVALAETRLELLRFDWDGAATLSNEVPADLIRNRRPRPESESALVIYDSSGGSVVTLAAGTVSTRPAFRISPHANGVDVDGDRARVAFRLRRVGSNLESCWYGDAGEDDGAGSGDFTTDRHDVQVGGYHDWNWRYLADSIYLGTPENPTTSAFLQIDNDGGSQEDTNADGNKPIVQVGDLRLGTNGKIVEVSIPLSSGVVTGADPNNWEYAATGGSPKLLFWTATGGSKTLMFEAPHRVGEALLGFKVIGWIDGSDAGDIMTATIQRLDSDSATGTLTQETLDAGDNTWDGVGDPSPAAKTMTLATPVAGSATDRWFLQLFTVLNSAPTYYVSHVVARYRRTEI